jgi:hypothetical protein
MTEQETNLVLEHLQCIQTTPSVIEADIGDLKTRMSAMEVHLGQLTTSMGGLNRRMDRFDERLAHRAAIGFGGSLNERQAIIT